MRIGDDLILVSLSSERYLVSLLAVFSEPLAKITRCYNGSAKSAFSPRHCWVFFSLLQYVQKKKVGQLLSSRVFQKVFVRLLAFALFFS